MGGVYIPYPNHTDMTSIDVNPLPVNLPLYIYECKPQPQPRNAKCCIATLLPSLPTTPHRQSDHADQHKYGQPLISF